MILHLIRHALPTLREYDNRPPGPGLGIEGIAQAVWMTELLHQIQPDLTYTSQFTRSQETIRYIFPDQPFTIVPALNERQPDEETHESLVARVHQWWEQNSPQWDEQNIVIVSHCGPINMILEKVDPEKTILQYLYVNEYGCLTPVAGIWELTFQKGQLTSGSLTPCPHLMELLP